MTNKRSNKTIRDADNAFNAKDYRQAVLFCQTALEKSPENPQLHYRLGASYYCLNDFTKAAEEFEYVTQVSMANSMLYLIWGITLMNAGKYAEAGEKFEQAGELDPGNFKSYRYLGDILLGFGNIDEAIIQYQQALKVNPKYTDGMILYGLALTTQGKYQDALTQFQGALALDPNNGIALRNKARTLRLKGDHQGSENIFREMLKGKMFVANDYLEFAELLRSQGRTVKSIEFYEKYLSLNPGSAMGQFQFGQALTEIKEFRKATDAYRKAIELDSNLLDAHIGLINLRQTLKEYENAISACKEMAKSEQGEGLGLYQWGNVLIEMKLYEEARTRIAQALKSNLSPLYVPYARHNLAYIYQIEGNYKDARMNWQGALDEYRINEESAFTGNNPDYFLNEGQIYHYIFQDYNNAILTYQRGLQLESAHTGILTNLAILSMDKKEHVLYADTPQSTGATSLHWQAMEYYQKAENVLKTRVSQNESAPALVEYSKLLIAMEKFDEAEKRLSRALELDDKLADAYVNMGVVYTKKEKYKEAIQFFKTADSLNPNDFNVISNLAEACLRAKFLDLAEYHYDRILDMAPAHIDSLIGLGEVYTAYAEEAGNVSRDIDAEEMFSHAVDQYTKALNLENEGLASKILKHSEAVAVHYARGYARVKLYEAQQFKNFAILIQARNDFRMVPKADKRYHKARRALAKIADKMNIFSPQTLGQRIGPWIIFFMALLMFIAGQYAFFYGQPVKPEQKYILTENTLSLLVTEDLPPEFVEKLESVRNLEFTNKENFIAAIEPLMSETEFEKFGELIIESSIGAPEGTELRPIEPGYYALFTFGAIIFMIAGLYLQQISRLKFAGIEIEKSPLEQISLAGTLGIGK